MSDKMERLLDWLDWQITLRNFGWYPWWPSFVVVVLVLTALWIAFG